MIEWGHPDPICLKNRLLFRFSKTQRSSKKLFSFLNDFEFNGTKARYW